MKLKTELYLKIFCTVILLALSISVYINGRTLTCDRCAIEIKASKTKLTANSEAIFDTQVKFEDLLNSIKNETCVLQWIKHQGWIYSKEGVTLDG